MDTENHSKTTWDFVASVLLLSFIFGMAMTLLWCLMVLCLGDWIYPVHQHFFGITRSQFNGLNYYGIAFTKVVSFVFFLGPYVSIKFSQKRHLIKK